MHGIQDNYSFEEIKQLLESCGLTYHALPVASNMVQLGEAGKKDTTIHCQPGRIVCYATDEDYDNAVYQLRENERFVGLNMKGKGQAEGKAEIASGEAEWGGKIVTVFQGNLVLNPSSAPKYQPHCIYVYGKDAFDGLLRILAEGRKKMGMAGFPGGIARPGEGKGKESMGKREYMRSKQEPDLNFILYGPPGTGKTYHSVNYAVAICEGKPFAEVEKEDYGEVLSRFHALKEKGRVAFTTFHQSYGYEEFIEGIKPITDENGNILYAVANGIFKDFCENAGLPQQKQEQQEALEPCVFIIDEINRGNISKIFGELITLIEDTKRKGCPEEMAAILPYSHTAFSVPKNVYILGTMNTADRSIALMDTALRRRFSFIEKMPDSSVLERLGIGTITAGNTSLNVAAMLDVMNQRIEYLYDREHTIGHAFFTKLKNAPTIDTLATIFQKNVIPLLQEYFYEDYAKIQYVLGDNGKEASLKFVLDETLDSREIFHGAPDIDLPERKYQIQETSFHNIMSYKGIGKNL